MNGASFAIQVHILAMEHPIVLHAIVKRKYLYFNAYGIPHTHLSKVKIDDILEGKITPEDVMKEIEINYEREIKNVPIKEERRGTPEVHD